MKAWIARDWSGVVYLYPLKPQKGQFRWESVAQAYQFIDDRLLPPDINPQWEDEEPIKVELKIEKNMKEMSIEEKAKRYDEAIEKLHEIITMDNKPVNPKEMGEYLFPELKESEDDEIRESIAGFLKTISSLKDGQTVSNEDFDTKVILEWVAWLKKQGKQKSSWSVEDELMLKDAIEFIETGWSDKGKSHLVYWLKSLKQRIGE